MPIGTFREFMAFLLPTPAALFVRFDLVMTDIQILAIELHLAASHRLVQARTGHTKGNAVRIGVDLRFFQIEWNRPAATIAELTADLEFIDERLASPINDALGALKDKKTQDVVSHMQEFDRSYHEYFGQDFDYEKYATGLSLTSLPREIALRKTRLKSLLNKL